MTDYDTYLEASEAARTAIADALDWSEPHGMQVEVIMWAMMYLRDHPGSTIPEAIDFGLEEWLK